MTTISGPNFDDLSNFSEVSSNPWTRYDKQNLVNIQLRYQTNKNKKQQKLPSRMYKKFASTTPLISYFFMCKKIVAKNRKCTNPWARSASDTYTKTSPILILKHHQNRKLAQPGCWQFSFGILYVDGFRIPNTKLSFWEQNDFKFGIFGHFSGESRGKFFVHTGWQFLLFFVFVCLVS